MPADGTLTAISPQWFRQPLVQLLNQYTPHAVRTKGLAGPSAAGSGSPGLQDTIDGAQRGPLVEYRTPWVLRDQPRCQIVGPLLLAVTRTYQIAKKRTAPRT